jgi:hypothetical protein
MAFLSRNEIFEKLSNMSTDLLHISGVTESNGDIISGLPCPLVAETTSDQVFGKLKRLFKNSETGGDGQV